MATESNGEDYLTAAMDLAGDDKYQQALILIGTMLDQEVWNLMGLLVGLAPHLQNDAVTRLYNLGKPIIQESIALREEAERVANA